MLCVFVSSNPAVSSSIFVGKRENVLTRQLPKPSGKNEHQDIQTLCNKWNNNRGGHQLGYFEVNNYSLGQ